MYTAYRIEDIRLPGHHSAVALGFFDGVHIGHQCVIRQVVEQKRNGLTPCVFTFCADGDIPENKRTIGMIQSDYLKMQSLDLMGIEFVLSPHFDSFKNLTAEQFVRDLLVKRMRASFVCCGENFRFGRRALAGVKELSALCKEEGIALSVVGDVSYGEGLVSSTRIRGLIREGRIEEVNELLYRPYKLYLKVEHGRKIGSTLLGFPTINQTFPKNYAIPRFGVYASKVLVGKHYYDGVTNIGVKPTVGSPSPVCETHIIGFDGDLYDQYIEVSLLNFLRPEVKFASLEELKAQIAKDKADAEKILAPNPLYNGQDS